MKLRLIAPYRPGYGKSETHKGVTGEKHLNMACADMVELMDKLNLSKISILGLAMGSIIATRFTHLYPQKVDHLFAISHAPMWRDEWAESMPKKQRLLLNAVKIAPSLSALLLRATIAYIYRGNVHDLFETSCGDSAADLHAINTPEISNLLQRDFSEGVSQGYQASQIEILIARTDHSQEAAALSHRFTMLQGDDDQVFNLSKAKDFARLIPGTELRIVKGAGHLLLNSHWEVVLNTIKRKL